MLLIHGIGSSSGDFDPVIHALTEFCQPTALDLRGHGESSKPEAGYHYTDYVRDLEEAIDTLGIKRPIVLGHSLGGIIALFWAMKHPDVSKGIIIEDSPLRSGEDFRESFEGWLALNAMPTEAVREWYAARNPAWSDAVLDQRAKDMTRTKRAAIEELFAASMAREGLDNAPDFGGITSPLLFLHGDSESGSMVHPEDLAMLPEMIPQVEILRVESAGHTIHRSHVDEWLAAVRRFVENLV